jgi:hypothetical protein
LFQSKNPKLEWQADQKRHGILAIRRKWLDNLGIVLAPQVELESTIERTFSNMQVSG